MFETGADRQMRLSSWWSAEALYFWLALIILAIVYGAPIFWPEWTASPESGRSRLLTYPEVGLLHGSIATSLLLFLLLPGKKIAILRGIVGWVAVGIGFYAFWWPGLVPTIYPLIWGGAMVGAKWLAKKNQRD